MTPRDIVHNFFRFFGLKFQRTVSSFGNELAKYEIERNEYETDGTEIYFKELNLSIKKEHAAPVLIRYANAVQLVKQAGFQFSVNSEGELHANNDHVKFKIHDEEELFILTEVFLEGSYNLITPQAKKIALIDVGMNVGITSLFFASKENVEKVYSFEPFTPTYNMALENIKLNHQFAAKIEARNFGLAKENGEIEVAYSPEQKGRMGLHGLPDTAGRILSNVTKEVMQIRSASHEFAKIREEVKDHFVVCKIDTEGAEYDIVESLYENNLLSIPGVYFIEWHKIKPTEIVEKLKKNNYYIVETAFTNVNAGMIYAIKSEQPDNI
jgi:FkbM family methyltransferase